MPYRVDIRNAPDGAFDRLVELGAIDAEPSHDGGIAALMPDSVAPEQLARALGVDDILISSAVGRDAGSVWLLQPRPIDIGRLRIVPAHTSAAPNSLTSAAQSAAQPSRAARSRAKRTREKIVVWLPPLSGRRATAADLPPEGGSHRNYVSGSEALRDDALKPALRLNDANAFGTGLHPTTGLCLEALQEAVDAAHPDAVLDVGTGSGVLALAALVLGVPGALGIDIDDEALRVAAENARINALHDRLRLSRGGPETVTGAWPLVLANVLAAPLIEMAPALVRRVGRQGRLVLSGIPAGVEPEVEQAYRHLGMRQVQMKSRNGWIALVLQASW